MLASEDLSGATVPTPIGQEELEGAVFAALLTQAAPEPFSSVLAMQVGGRSVVRRALSGAGFFLELSVPRTLPPILDAPSPLPLDVIGHWPGKPLSGGFILFTDAAGYIDMLEGYTHEGDWLADVTGFQLTNSLGEPILQ